MTWGAVGTAAVGVVGSLAANSMSSKSNGGAGTTTSTKEPWLQAQPWIMGNMISGQNLQNQYTAQPFNQQQVNAYSNLANQTNYVNQLTPSLLGQISAQHVGFDPSNPTAMPTAYNFNGIGNTTGATGTNTGNAGAGLLAQLANAPSSATSAAVNAPAPAPAAAPQSTFVNQSSNYSPAGIGYAALQQAGMGVPQAGNPFNGGYGSFKYGDQPQPGTQEYADKSMYLAYGGSDPLGLYNGGNGTGTTARSGIGDGTSSAGTASNGGIGGIGGTF